MTRTPQFMRQANRYSRLVAVCVAMGGLTLGLTGCDDQAGDPRLQIGANPKLPEPQQYFMPPIKIAKAKPWEKGEAPSVSQGLQVHALATGFEHPRQVYVLPNGDVLVVESNGPSAPIHRPKDIVFHLAQSYGGAGAKGGNRITLLRGLNADGTAQQRTVFLDHLNSPFGVALVGNDFYVANTDAIIRYPYTEGQTSITAEGTKLTDLPGGPIDHHWTKALLASQDGSKLYVGVGSNSNITENGIGAEYERAAIWEVDRASGAHRIFASGVRNPTGLAWEPESGKLWAIANERDELGPDLVPDYLTSVQDGGFYGWPYSYYGQHLDPRVQPQRPDLVARAIPPDYALSSHVAPLGVAMYKAGGGLPPSYQNGAFVGEHGSWDRVPFNGYKVVFVPFSGGKPSGQAQDVVTGFLDANGDARGRPVGVALDHAGGLLIADDLGDTVWRVSAASATSSNPTSTTIGRSNP
jgi:glucose/arabinose dehydrogenase